MLPFRRNKLVSDVTDNTFALSFTGDGYLYTDSLLNTINIIDETLNIQIKPFSTEGLVMFAYDEEVSFKNNSAIFQSLC